MKSMTKPCYKLCINKKYLLKPKFYEKAKGIVAQLAAKQKRGRPKIECERALSGIYYVLKTGCQWNALPKCFGSYSAVHRMFKWLVSETFFEKMWYSELRDYEKQVGLKLNNQVGDCVITKAPLGGPATGNSPVDRRKLGTKRSVISDENGVPIGLTIGSANQNDAKLLSQTIASVEKNVTQPYEKKLRLDGIYDTQEVRVILFNKYYIPRISPNNRRRKIKKEYPYNDETPIRWVIERSHSWSNRFRRILIRWEKSLENYTAMVQYAFAITIFNKLRI